MKIWRKIVTGIGAVLGSVWLSLPTFAAQPNTSILKTTDVKGILELVVRILVYGIGAVAVIGVIIAGILYLTARDNEQQVERAKKRLFEIALGLLAWALIYGLLRWLIPGFEFEL